MLPAQPRRIAAKPAIIVLQVLSILLAGMICDTGLLGLIAAGSAVISWLVAWVVALVWEQVHDRVLLWSWIGAAVGLLPLGLALGLGPGANRAVMREAQLGSNERAIVLACLQYAQEDAGRTWPTDLAALAAWTDGEMTPLLQVSWHREVAQPFVYVRPTAKPPAEQPVLLCDPACTRRGRVVACCADGHVEWFAGEQAERVWAEAKRLAVETRDGVTRREWTTLEK